MDNRIRAILYFNQSANAMEIRERLIDAARNAATRSYAPYSRFRVGCALLCEDGTIVSGANVENRSYGLTICAERSAIVAAVSSGARRFNGIAVAGIDSDYPLPPCGACRQVISEFMDDECPVFFAGKSDEIEETTVGTLYPYDSLDEWKKNDRKS